MNDPALFQGEINYKKARIHLRNLKISRNTGPISTKLAKCILGRKGFKFRNMKGHVLFHREIITKMFKWSMWPMGLLLILVSQLLQTLGRVGRELKVYAVDVGNHTWTFNPVCRFIVPSIEPGINNTNGGHDQRDHSSKTLYNRTWSNELGPRLVRICPVLESIENEKKLCRVKVIQLYNIIDVRIYINHAIIEWKSEGQMTVSVNCNQEKFMCWIVIKFKFWLNQQYM